MNVALTHMHYRDTVDHEQHFEVSVVAVCLGFAVNSVDQRDVLDVEAQCDDVENDVMCSASGMVAVEEPMEYSSFRKL